MENIRDKVDGKECDLSLSELTTVPVKELATVPKATHLDLSCNILTSLPDNFCQLSHLVRLDLSKNALGKLPENFGALQNLQYVDLFSNKLTTLPVSFHRLDKLRWLDVKDNQLADPLKNIVGDCLDDVQCKQCAKNVVAFMKQVEAERQKLKQKRQKEEKEKEARLKAETERINRERRNQKKAEKEAEKERRRKEYEEKMASQKQMEKNTEESEETNNAEGDSSNGFKAMKMRKETGGVGCCGVLLAVLVGAVALVVGFYVFCQQYGDEEICRKAAFQVKKYQYYINKNYRKYFPIE